MESNFRKRLIRNVAVSSLVFVAVLGIIFYIFTIYVPDLLVKRYIKKSRMLARRLSRSIQDINVFSGNERMIKKIVRLNFPEEKNIIHIVVRDKRGQTRYEERGEGEMSFAEILKQRSKIIQRSMGDKQIEILKLKNKSREVMYYKVSAPIYKDGEKVGEVFVGISRRILFNRIEINRNQLSRMIFAASIAMFCLLTLSFLVNMRFFIKLKKSEEREGSLRQLAYLGEISGGLAHEIRNPLNTMSINLQLLRESIAAGRDEAVERKITVLENAKNHAANVLNKFLDFTKHRSRHTQRFDVVEAARDVCQMLEHSIKQNNIELDFVAEQEKIQITADHAEIKQVLFNLILNSIDALKEQAQRLIRLELGVRSKDNLHIRVADNGPGMDEFTKANIYKPFFSKKTGGSGLGLSIVRRVVEQCGGEIECRVGEETQMGQGVEFTLMLKKVVCT